MRNLGGAIGIAVSSTMLNDRTNLHYERLAEHLNSNNPAMLNSVQHVATSETAARGGDALHGHAAALRTLWSLTLREAQTQTYADAFFVIALCFVVATAMVPLMRKISAPVAPSRDAH